MNNDKLYLIHIIENIRDIQDFVTPGHDEFMQSKLMQNAVIRCFEIIGEASRNLSEELRTGYPNVTWVQISKFRNFLVHVYWAIDYEKVWEIIRDDLPVLKTQIEAILQELGEPPQPPTEA